jgi:polyisoprenoid-binding protein YceI
MKRRSVWIISMCAILLILLVVVASVVYVQHASTVAADQQHQASGAIQTTVTPLPTNVQGNLKTYQIVSAQSTASYSVYENLIMQNKPNNDAIGSTHSVTGSFQIGTGSSPLVTGMTIKVDLRTLQSDSQMRDSHVQDSLDTANYPYATFVSVSTQNLPASYTDGQTVNFKLLGNLTLHGKTNGETFTVQGKVNGNTITGTATTTVYMTDFGIQPPNIANIVTVQNKTVLTIDFTAQAS